MEPEVQFCAGEKVKFPASIAKAVVRELLPELRPCCLAGGPDGEPWLKVAGSLRRKKAEVGDVEFVYVAAVGEVRRDLFVERGNVMDAKLEELITRGVLTMRRSASGSFSWGPQIKLAVHAASGLPLDFFATTAPRFFNYLVCRTGSKENNVRLAASAAERGLKWHPFHGGFEVVDLARAGRALERADMHTGQMVPARSEEEVFAIAGLAYLEPWER